MSEKKSEIWIQIGSSKEISRAQEFLLMLPESFQGAIPVNLFCAKERAVRRLPECYRKREAVLDSLRAEFGEENVKYIRGRTGGEDENAEEFRKKFYEKHREKEIHNLITDYLLPDGRRAHIESHLLAPRGMPVTAAEMVRKVRTAIPDGSQIVTVWEVYGEYSLDDLVELARCMNDILSVKNRLLYRDDELLRDYIKELAAEL